jgi:hypothetical protein
MSLVRDPKFLDLFARASEGRYLDECWPWPGGRSKGGYGIIWLEGKQHRVSRLVLGLVGEADQALHVCDNPPCVNPAHLQRGTIRENQYDKGRKGRAARGEENRGGGKLTASDVRAIRERLASEEKPTFAQVGREFGVSGVLVSKIWNGILWRSVQ